MANEQRLNDPWLIAVWPGMGHVAISAGYYLMAKLGMHRLAEFSAEELFDVGHVDVKQGLIRTGRLPQSRLFVWNDPGRKRDLIVFIGEAQPPQGKYAFCCRLIESARQLGVERVFTFAAMATEMHPGDVSRVFGAATDEESLAELKRIHLEILEDGHIGGLNGVLLGVAGERGMHGACLLGEMPHVFAQLPFPKASLAVLKSFAAIAGISMDYTEMSEQAKHMDKELGKLLAQMEENGEQAASAEDESFPQQAEASADEEIGPEDRDHVERLFEQAGRDRSNAYELKRELDRLALYREYEDRFLDLFKRPG